MVRFWKRKKKGLPKNKMTTATPSRTSESDPVEAHPHATAPHSQVQQAAADARPEAAPDPAPKATDDTGAP